ncbi:uncharacterized protein [Panulirus ornatus]|uniref:uncharacterized protein n=1 Tax=Panulirus ornatus TaxID=150431 RepID=UPI003A8A6061
MAHRVLLSRLTMFVLHLWAAVEATPVASRIRTEVIDAHHHHHSRLSLRNFFRKSDGRSDFEIEGEADRNESAVELHYHPGGSRASPGRRSDVWAGATTTPTSPPGLSEGSGDTADDPGLQQWFSEADDADGNQTNPRSIIYCTNGVRDLIYNTSSGVISTEMIKYENFSAVTDVYSNKSLLVENGGWKESLLGIRNGEVSEASPCDYPKPVPSAWTSFFKDQELLCLVNPHWLQYDPPSHLSHLVLASVYVVIMVVGLVGNGLVMYLFISSRALRTPSNLFILNLAVSDFLLLAALGLYIYNSVYEGPAAGKVGCDVYGFVGGFTGTTSIMTLAAISFDRYLVITFPLDPFKRFSHRQVLGIIVVTWMYSTIFSAIPLVGIVGINYTPEGFLTSCSFDYLTDVVRTRVYIFSFFVAAWLVPLCIITFSYLSIVSIVSKQERHYYTCQGTFANSFKHQSIRRKKSSEVKLAKVASGIIGLWVVAWTPYAVVALLGIFNQRALITPVVSMIPALFCKTAACLDPYVYALSHPRFKNELNKRFLRCRPSFLTGMRNGAVQGFSISTFSEIREERELSEAQGWDTTDPSFSSLGPLLQRNASCSSHPTLRTRSRASLSSPGSRSLISPTGEIYPRKSLSTYSFRRTSRSLNFNEKREEQEASRRARAAHTELQTTVLIEFPNARFPKLPFPLSRSLENGVEELSVHSSEPSSATNARSSQATQKVVPPSQDRYASSNNGPLENQSSEEVSSPNHKEDNKVDYKRCFAKCVLPGQPAAAALRSERGRAKRRSNSLPNMNHNNGDKKVEGRFPKNVLLQLFHGKILHSARRNKSQSSLYHDERRAGNIC